MDVARLSGQDGRRNTGARPTRNGSGGTQEPVASRPWRRSGGRRHRVPRAQGRARDLGKRRPLTVLSQRRVSHRHDRLTQLGNGEQRCPALPLRPPDQHVTGRQVPNPELGHVVLPELQTDVPLLAPRWPRQLLMARRRPGRTTQSRDASQRALVVAVVRRRLLRCRVRPDSAGTCSARIRAARIARAAMARARVRAARIARARGAVVRGRGDGARPTTGGCSSCRCEVVLHGGSNTGLVVALAEGMRGAIVSAELQALSARRGFSVADSFPAVRPGPLPQARTLTKSKIGQGGQFVAGNLRRCVMATSFAGL